MPRLFAFLVLAAALSWASSSLARAPQTWEFRDGQWRQITNPSTRPAAATQQDVHDPVLDEIEAAINRGAYRDSAKRAVVWLLRNPTSPVRDRALFLEAQALYGFGDRLKAYYYLDELLDEYPESPLYARAVERQYQIADAFLNGYKSRFMLLPLLDRTDEAIEMLWRVQQRSPGSPLAEQALKRTADYFFRDGQFDLSAAVYGVYIERYPRSPLVPEVRLKQAYSNLAQMRGLRFDPTPVIDARAQLLDLMAQYPDVARQENVPALLERIDSTFAKKLAVTADFYRRTDQPRAAAYVYQALVNTYPNSSQADAAREALQRLPRPVVQPPTTAPAVSMARAMAQ